MEKKIIELILDREAISGKIRDLSAQKRALEYQISKLLLEIKDKKEPS